MNIVCPTHGRAGEIRTQHVVDDLILCVAESQEPEYAEHHPNLELVVHPDDVVGLLPKRQWISEKFGDVLMLDDDLTQFRFIAAGPGEPAQVPKRDVRPRLEQIRDNAADVGAFLWGFSNVCDTRTYVSQRPFRLTGYVAGHAFGLRAGHKLWWPTDGLKTKDDWWISGLNAYHHRIVWVDERYGFYQAGTFSSRGGQGAHRTIDKEQEAFEYLRRNFGSAIRHKKGTPTHRARSAWQPRLALPWAS